MKEGLSMAIVNFKIVHVDYAKYRKEKDEKENHVSAVNYETCRQNLNEAMNVLGLDTKFFKENFVSNQPFQFNDQDKKILFELFDRFTANEFVLIRKGQFLEVPIETLEFYINSFTTILIHLDVEDEIVDSERASMLKCTQFYLAVEYDKVRKELVRISKDLEKIINFDNSLNSEDDTVFFQHIHDQLNQIKNYIRHVHMNMSNHREDQEGFMAELKALQPILKNDREGVKEKILNHVKLDQVLHQNPRYVELEELMVSCVERKTFLKHKIKNYVEIQNEITDISRKTQLELFGRIIDNESLIQKNSEAEKMPSRELLEKAVRDYLRFYEYKKSSKDDEPFIGDTMCEQLFGD